VPASWREWFRVCPARSDYEWQWLNCRLMV
jgi:hypothetical protein